MHDDIEKLPRIIYSDHSGYYGDAVFMRVCVQCGRFVKAHDSIFVGDEGLHPGPNAQCARCGPTRMEFEGFV